MTIEPTLAIQNHVVQPSASLHQEAEKAKKIAIDNIILYLKDRTNTVRLKRSYTKRDVFEFVDSISDSALPAKKLKVPEKSIGSPSPAKPFFLERVSKETQGHFEIVLKAVQYNGLELQFASKELKNDYRIVTSAIRQNGLALQYASREWLNSERMALLAVSQNGLALQYLPIRLRDRFDIVAAAVRQNSLAFSFATKRLQDSTCLLYTSPSPRD